MRLSRRYHRPPYFVPTHRPPSEATHRERIWLEIRGEAVHTPPILR